MAQPAGWYADPSGLPARRWWDGEQWTDHIQPGGAPIPPPNGFFPPVPPTGPPVPEPPSYVATVPENTTTARSESPVPPPPHPEVPARLYSMPPVDASPIPAPPSDRWQSFPSSSASPSSSDSSGSGEIGLTRQQRAAGFIGLALIAVLILALTAVILLP